MKVRFCCSLGLIREEEIIHMDGLSEEEIQEEFDDWVSEKCNPYWEKIEEDPQEEEVNNG